MDSSVAHRIVLDGALVLSLAVLIARAMQRRSLRHNAAEPDVAQGYDNALLQGDTEPPWWRVELSGFHLILWLGVPFLVVAFAHDKPDEPLWLLVTLGFLMVGWFTKIMFWVFLAHHPGDADERTAQYRWFGTPRGTLVAAAVVSGMTLLGAIAFSR